MGIVPIKYFYALTARDLALSFPRGMDGTFAGNSNGVGARLGSNHPSVRAAVSNKAIKNARQANEYALKFYWNDKQARQDFDSARAFAFAVEQAFNERRALHLSFSEDQPRDPDGKFASGGSASSDATKAEHEAKILDAIKNGGKDLHTLSHETQIPMSKYGDTKPHEAPLNSAVVRLINAGKVEASNPRFGAPVISLKK